jgi:Leucine-rich repeat (LRR) protein
VGCECLGPAACPPVCPSSLTRRDRTLDGSSFAFSTLDLSRRGLQLLHSAEPQLHGLSSADGACTGSSVFHPLASVDPDVLAKEFSTYLHAALPDDPFSSTAESLDRRMFGALSCYRHVRHLDVSRNRLTDLSPACGMPSLLALSAAGNALVSLPHPLAQRRLKFLQSLDLSFNLLSRLDGILPRREALNAVRKAQAAPADPDGEPVDPPPASAESPLSLRTAPAGLIFPWLRELNLNGNLLESLSGCGAVGTGPLPFAPMASSTCPRLARIEAQSNALGPSLSGVGSLPSLTELVVGRNLLASLGGLFGCHHLRLLVCEHNKLSSLRALVDPTDTSHRREWGWGSFPPQLHRAALATDEDAPPSVSVGSMSDAEFQAHLDALYHRQCASEESQEDFGLPSDRSVCRLIAIGEGLHFDGESLVPLDDLRSSPLSELIEARKALLVALAKQCEESSAAPTATLLEDIIPPPSGIGFPLQGADAHSIRSACLRILDHASTAVDHVASTGASLVRDLSSTIDPVAVAAASSLLASPLQDLEVLDLSNNPITDLRELYWLRGLPSLRVLDLRGCPVSDEGEGAITECLLRVGPHLVNVNGTPVTEAHRQIAAKERAKREEARRAWRQEQSESWSETLSGVKEAHKSAPADDDD